MNSPDINKKNLSIQPFTLIVMLKDNEVLIGFCYLHFYARKIRMSGLVTYNPGCGSTGMDFLKLICSAAGQSCQIRRFTRISSENNYIYTCLKIGCVIIFLKTWILTTHIYRSFDPFEETYIREEFILGYQSYM